VILETLSGDVQMEIAGVLIAQRENGNSGAFLVCRVDHWVTQAIPSTDARVMPCRRNHESEATVVKGSSTNCKPLCILNNAMLAWDFDPVTGSKTLRQSSGLRLIVMQYFY
jgi:hypothetical protein